MNLTFLLTPEGQRVTWARWKKMGGCGLSLQGSKAWHGLHPKAHATTTLGELQRRSVLAGRELARFAKDHLNQPDWAEIEYTYDPMFGAQLREVSCARAA